MKATSVSSIDAKRELLVRASVLYPTLITGKI